MIEVITMWYNEAFLVPFFLNHYSFADCVRIIDDAETTDGTAEIVSRYPNAIIEHIKFDDGFDNDIAVARLNQCYRQSKADWVIGVDADEFVLTPNLPQYLKDRTEDVFMVRLYEVYRHIDDRDLDPNIPIFDQRRHGDPGAVKGQNRKGMKPIVVRTGRDMKWMAGQHRIWNRHKLVTTSDVLLGVHWMLADPSSPFIERRLRGKLRQSRHNIAVGHSSHCNDVTEEKVREQLGAHMHDGQVF